MCVCNPSPVGAEAEGLLAKSLVGKRIQAPDTERDPASEETGRQW